MAPFANLSREERLGLLVAGVAHVALAVVLVLNDKQVEPVKQAERITVSLATDVSLESTAPDPSENPAASMAPVVVDVPEPEILPPPPPSPVPRPVQTSRPTPTPTPTATPTRRPTPTPSPTATRRPTPTPTATATRRPTPTPSPTRSAGGSRLNDSFLEGVSDANGDTGQAGDRPSAQQQASIDAAIIRQLKPHWNPPSGVEVDRLVTVVRFRLNQDGTLNGNPEVLRQTGITDANRPQASRHAEQAIRAVRLAAPFNLPERFYSGWRVVTSTFDNRLAQ